MEFLSKCPNSSGNSSCSLSVTCAAFFCILNGMYGGTCRKSCLTFSASGDLLEKGVPRLPLCIVDFHILLLDDKEKNE